MITGWQQDLQSVLRQTDPGELAASLLDLYRSCDSMTDFAAQTGAYIASTLYREEYPQFVPHSLMGFIGAVQLGRFLQPQHHFRAVAQALWYYARERVREAFEWTRGPVELPPSVEGLENALEQSRRQKDFEAFFGVILAGVQDRERREDVLSWLLRAAGGDQFNIGHKHLYLAKSIALLDYLRWESPQTYLFPAVHYFLLAPEDRRAEETLARRLVHHGLELQERSFERFELSLDETLQVRDSILGDPPESVVDTLLGAFEYGVAPGVLAEALLVTAAHLVLSIPHDRWILSVHGFNYAQSVQSTLEYHPLAAQQRMVLLTGLYLRQIVDSAGPLKVREPFFTPRPEMAQPLPTELEEAIDVSVPADAMAIIDWLYQHGRLGLERIECLALAAVKADAHVHFGHDLKFAYAALEVYHSSTTPLREVSLLALAKFLAESEKSREFDHALAKAIRT